MAHVIDRRKNNGNESAVNRARFLRRYNEQIRRAVHDIVAERSIKDMEQGGNVTVPRKDISEPVFRHGSGGNREVVSPGNRDFVKDDRLPRPKQGGGSGSQAGTGTSQDDFVFALSRDEFLQIFFDDLELPRLERDVVLGIEEMRAVRAGYTTTGAPTNLAVVRTLRTALARRISLRTPIRRALDDVIHDLTCAPDDRTERDVDVLLERAAVLQRRLQRVPFLADVDLRYRNRVMVPQPTARAVMFCLMDVSASMDEKKKDLAKRFFTLLYLFLTKRYEHVELVFVRHTDDAEEVDEQTFFHDPRSGGTVVLSALELMAAIARERYGSGWNVYGAQASDGDVFGADGAKSRSFLTERILPLTRYFAYLETGDEHGSRVTPLWVEYQQVKGAADSFAMRRVTERREIYPVFRELFRKQPRTATS